MIKEVYTIEQLKEKIKGYKRKAIASTITMVAGIGIFVGSIIYPITHLPRTSQIVEGHINAQTTLDYLKSEYNLSKDFDYPYKNNEIKDILGRDTARTSKLETVMKIVGKDISKIEENPEYIEYEGKRNKLVHKMFFGMIGGLVLVLLGGITERRYNIRGNQLQESLNSKS